VDRCASTMLIAILTARLGDHRQRVATPGRMGLRDRQLVGGTVNRPGYLA
jgi:hypothetical protein